jgi:ABC-type glutathione transport system ATPase component
LLACRPSLAERKPRLSTLADYGLDGGRSATARAAVVEQAEERPTTTAVLVKDDGPTHPAVEVSGLSKTFGAGGRFRGRWPGITAVKDVSFQLHQGSTLAVVGESGSGKTTLARMIMGLEVPSEGSVSFLGERRPARPSTTDLRKQARQVQMVFQNPYRSLDPRQTIGASLDEMLGLHFDLDRRARTARSQELLARVHLDRAIADARPGQLSGGQRQRACIARALAAEPRVLVLDEAVSALDVSVQAQVLNVLADIRDETGVSFLFVTHDLAVVRQIADDIIVMRFGEIVERGPADEVLDAPQHEYTRLLLESVPREGWKPGRR